MSRLRAPRNVEIRPLRQLISVSIIVLCKRNGIKPKNVLEVGAGDGSILRCLADYGFSERQYALEISQSGVDVIHNQKIPGLVSCQVFDGYNIPFKDDYFDISVLSHVLEYVEYERALLKELKRVSKYQIIEIPMDCNALGDEVYHLLGPSYRHINAHTPDSLRFMLSTEGLSVVDDLIGVYSLDLREYDHFVNNSNERTPETVEAFRRQYQIANAEFAASSRVKQQRRASTFTVLTCKEEAEKRLERVLMIIKHYIVSGRIQVARLIFNYYVPKPLLARYALEISRDVQIQAPKIALEFLDRILAYDSDSANALSLRNHIEISMNNNDK